MNRIIIGKSSLSCALLVILAVILSLSCAPYCGTTSSTTEDRSYDFSGTKCIGIIAEHVSKYVSEPGLGKLTRSQITSDFKTVLSDLGYKAGRAISLRDGHQCHPFPDLMLYVSAEAYTEEVVVPVSQYQGHIRTSQKPRTSQRPTDRTVTFVRAFGISCALWSDPPDYDNLVWSGEIFYETDLPLYHDQVFDMIDLFLREEFPRATARNRRGGA